MPKQKIAIVTFCYLPFDAVSTDALGMRNSARNLGYEAEVFAENFPPDFESIIRPVGDLADFIVSPDNLIIYHFSIGWENGERLISQIRCGKWVKFHNITPPEFFEGVETLHAYSCRMGREMLPHLGRIGATLFLSDSKYNRDEIQPFIPTDVPSLVLYPFHQVDDPDPSPLSRFPVEKPIFLAVGRLAPNKRYDLMIEAFAKMRRICESNVNTPKLVIVGRADPALITYTQYLENLAVRLNVQNDIQWRSNVNRDELLALYQNAYGLVIASEHEGFCVPVAEAFAEGCPVISSTKTALRETLAGGALTFESYDANHLAACMLEIAENRELRAHLRQRGREVFRSRFSVESIGKEFKKILAERFTTIPSALRSS